MDGANYMSNNNGKVIVKNQQQQQWGCVKEETFSSDQFQWPAKNYSCNFCRREFKSAQALGGHMNVHRRDRARLRLLPSWLADNSCPNPNFSLSSPTPSSCFTFRSNNSLSFNEEEKNATNGSCSWNKPSSSPPDDEDLHVLKKKKKSLVNLELKMGNLEGANEDLDLDLHL